MLMMVYVYSMKNLINVYKTMLKQQSDQHTRFAALFPQEKLTISAVTWNLFGSIPSSEAVDQLFNYQALKDKSDIIFIGSQECQRSLFLSFCCQSKQLWEERLIDSCPTHFLATSHTMRGLHIAVMIKTSLRDYFQFESKEKLRAGGPCDTMGNKGAICVQFSILGQQFQFINCHLAAHQHECERRNQTIHRILEEMVRNEGDVIFLGDLNYRIDMEKSQYRQLMASRPNTEAEMNYSSLFHRDQLSIQKDLQDNFLKKFEEGAISFPPTYKLGLKTEEYCKERIPGWTDRIFHRKNGKLQRSSYSCAYQLMGCDHRPVFAFFDHPIEEHALSLQTETFIGVKSGHCQLI